LLFDIPGLIEYVLNVFRGECLSDDLVCLLAHRNPLHNYLLQKGDERRVYVECQVDKILLGEVISA
jgi:hypothetical protein